MDGYLAPSQREPLNSESDSASVERSVERITSQKIPKQIIQNAAGIAVFTCMRNGLWMTGSGGSGILIARKSDGTWSPPSGIMLHTPTLSFIIGVDIYDCVLVVSNLAALESMTRPRVTLGEDVALTNGPIVPTQSDELRLSWRDLGNTVLAYMKARGQHQEVNLNGCILTERANENERFYEGNITQMDVLAGNVSRHVEETRVLFEVIKMAEGRTDFDRAVIDRTAALPAPGDAVIETPRATPLSPRPAFGIPKSDDPDPFGVLALEMAGLEIREAGSRLRPASSQLEYNPSPLSPVLSKFSRQSMETFNSRSNRGSYMSTRTVKSHVSDVATQTDTRGTSPSPRNSEEEIAYSSNNRGASDTNAEVDYTTVDMSSLRHISQEYGLGTVTIPEETEPQELSKKGYDAACAQDTTSIHPSDVLTKQDPPAVDAKAAVAGDGADCADDEDGEEEEDDDDEEEPVVFEVAEVQPARTQVVASRMIQARGNVVNIPKRIPPPLPRRSPARQSRLMKADAGADFKSPLRQTFSEADLFPDEDKTAQDSQSDDAKSTGDLTDGKSPQSPPLDLAIADVRPVKDIDNAIVEVNDASQSPDDSAGGPDELASFDQTEHPDAGQEDTEEIGEGRVDDIGKDGEKLDAPAEEEDTQLPIRSTEVDVAEDNQETESAPAAEVEPAVLDTCAPLSADESQQEPSLAEDDETQPSDKSDEVALKRESTVADATSSQDVAINDASAEASLQIGDEKTSVLEDEETASGEVHPTDEETHGSDTADDVREESSELQDDEDQTQPITQGTPRLEADESQHSDDDEDPFELERTVPFAKSSPQSDDEEYERHNLSNTATDDTPDDDELPTTPHNEQNDTSDSTSPKKHSSSIFTGVTEDRWSYDGSSLTTPTSDRAGSAMGSPIDGTPKRALDRCSKSNHGPQTINGEEEASAAESEGTTPTTIEV